jgi:cephalosporin-C deacetylase-like acetyl esterase
MVDNKARNTKAAGSNAGNARGAGTHTRAFDAKMDKLFRDVSVLSSSMHVVKDTANFAKATATRAEAHSKQVEVVATKAHSLATSAAERVKVAEKKAAMAMDEVNALRKQVAALQQASAQNKAPKPAAPGGGAKAPPPAVCHFDGRCRNPLCRFAHPLGKV